MLIAANTPPPPHTRVLLCCCLLPFHIADSAKLRASALRGWSFLYTSLSAPPATRQLEAQLSALSALLHDADVEVRAAAGEALALLYNTCGLGEEFGEDLDELDEEEDEEEEDPLLDQLSSPQQQQQQQHELAPAGQAAAAEQQEQQQQHMHGASSRSQQEQQQQGGVVLNGLPAGLVVPGSSSGKPKRDSDVMSLGSSISGLDMVIDRVRDLASNRGDRQRRSRRDRAAMKGCFRELRSVMEVREVVHNGVFVEDCLRYFRGLFGVYNSFLPTRGSDSTAVMCLCMSVCEKQQATCAAWSCVVMPFSSQPCQC